MANAQSFGFSCRPGVGHSLALAGVVVVAFQLAFSILPNPVALILGSLLPASGVVWLCLAHRRQLTGEQQAGRQLGGLNAKITQQSREMAAQALLLVQQRDGFKNLADNLADKQNWLEEVLAQLPAGVLLIDQNLNVVSKNRRFQEMLGLPADQPLKSLMDLHGWPAETIHGQPVSFENWPIVRAIRDGVIQHDYEMRIGGKEGTWFETAVSTSPIRDEQGRIRGGVLVMTDLAVRNANAERLRMLESAVVHANDAIIVLDAVSAQGKGRSVMYVNDGFCRLTGYTREEVTGRSLHFLRGEDTDPQTLEALRVALDTATPFRTELLNYRRDGGVVWVDLSLVPVQGPQGHCTHYIMIQRDITARKIAEASLRESEQLFRGIFETTSAGVSITDDSGKFVACNPAFAALVGRSVQEVLKLSPKDITHPDDWHDQAALMKAVQDGECDRYQFPKRYVKPDGQTVWTELTFAAIKDSDGHYQYGLGVSVDVSARHGLEEQLRQAQKMEALGQLAGGIAHDFNNLLTAVLCNLGLMRFAEQDPNRDLHRTAEQAATRAADLTGKLLGYARKNQLLAASTMPGALIDEVTDILRRTLDPRITIKTKIDTAATVLVDSTLVNQALFNLCLNARDAMPEGGVLAIEAADAVLTRDNLPHRDARPGVYVKLSVRDTGTGIDEAILDKLFEPFFTTKGVGKGTGLGLPMVHGIMKQHDGWVTVENNKEGGATFALYLPATAISLPKKSAVNARLSGDSGEHTPLPPDSPAPVASSATILLVDDEDMIRSLARAILRSHGFDVIEAEDGSKAVELFEQERNRISLVLMDLTMPRLSGRDAFRRMQSIDPAVRVLFSSGYYSDDMGDVEGSAGLLSKPYRPNDLITAVRRAMRKTRELTPV